MISIDRSVWDQLYARISELWVVDAHTHIQDDIKGFGSEHLSGNLAGTQSSVNKPSHEIIDESLRRQCMTRRTMLDVAHAMFYSWFAEIVEGKGGRLDDAVRMLGDNTAKERNHAAAFMMREIRDSRYSEYAEWLRYMFRLYEGVPTSIDPISEEHLNTVVEAVSRQRHDPHFAEEVLSKNKIAAYVTSIENRDKLPNGRPPYHPNDLDLAYCTHREAWNMFDFNGFLWPERATDFGLFTQGHKFEGERYILHLEEYLDRELSSSKVLKQAVRDFFFAIIRSPKSNPTSRILYVDGFQSQEMRFSHPYSHASVDYALRHCRDQIDGDLRRQVISCVSEAMLEALNEIGEEYRSQGEEFGVCIQLCGGARHFMDWAREIQSIPEYIPNLAQDEYPVWLRYPHVHFEYISAHEGLYRDMASAAKQVHNVSAGPWWHCFRRQKIADIVREQLSIGPICSIACGFTDARFVEMMAAKYRSLRLGVTDALAEFVCDPISSLYQDIDAAALVARDILYVNPAAVHHIPVSGDTETG